MAPRNRQSRAERRAEIGSRLLETMEGLLRGGANLGDLTVETLVAEAGISRSKFYVYFEDRQDMLSQWFEEISTELSEVSEGWWDIDESSTRDDLREALSQIVRAYHPHTTIMAAVYERALRHPSVRDDVTTSMEEMVAQIAVHIRAGQKAGFVNPKLPSKETAAWLAWMTEGTLHGLGHATGAKELDRQIDVFTDIVWSTLYAPARAT